MCRVADSFTGAKAAKETVSKWWGANITFLISDCLSRFDVSHCRYSGKIMPFSHSRNDYLVSIRFMSTKHNPQQKDNESNYCVCFWLINENFSTLVITLFTSPSLFHSLSHSLPIPLTFSPTPSLIVPGCSSPLLSSPFHLLPPLLILLSSPLLSSPLLHSSPLPSPPLLLSRDSSPYLSGVVVNKLFSWGYWSLC